MADWDVFDLEALLDLLGMMRAADRYRRRRWVPWLGRPARRELADAYRRVSAWREHGRVSEHRRQVLADALDEVCPLLQ